LNRLRAVLGFSYWSLSTYLKTNLKNAARYIELFETVAAREAVRYAVDGLVCGHIHKPAIKVINGTLYCNDGDWVESCTALVEYRDGSLGMVNWAEAIQGIGQGRMTRA
jgi:UDP-2,3-diacylglucosamine pyrophosphatase LpxH